MFGILKSILLCLFKNSPSGFKEIGKNVVTKPFENRNTKYVLRQVLMQTGVHSKIRVYQFMGQWETTESLVRDAVLLFVLLTKFLALRGMTLMVVGCQILVYPWNTQG